MSYLETCDECDSLNITIREDDVDDNGVLRLTYTCRDCLAMWYDWEGPIPSDV